MLPIARPYSPLRALTSETANSGTLVPKATIVMPMTTSLTPIEPATPMAPETSHWAPINKVMRPMINHIMAILGVTLSGISAS